MSIERDKNRMIRQENVWMSVNIGRYVTGIGSGRDCDVDWTTCGYILGSVTSSCGNNSGTASMGGAFQGLRRPLKTGICLRRVLGRVIPSHRGVEITRSNRSGKRGALKHYER